MTTITSAKNAKIKHILGLIDRRSMRAKHRQFFVEGVRAITAVYDHGWQVEWLIYCPENVQSDWAREIIDRTDHRARLEVNAYLQERISGRSDPSELMCVVAQAKDDLARIPLSENLLVVLADRPQNPGNLGSLIRTCDALNAHGLLIIGHAADLYTPRTVRASMGSFFALPVIRLGRFETLQQWMDDVRRQLGRLQMVGTSAHAEAQIFAHDLTGPTLLVLGNEAQGMSHRLSEMCDVNLTIPMFGSASSLNMAAAAAILLYEADRQRLTRGIL